VPAVSRVRCPIRLVLASASPRRQEILSAAGYEFETADPGEAEYAVAAASGPEALALAKARAKAQAVAAGLAGPALVVGADTLVALGDEVLGKPLDRLDALRILTRLSGTRHRVITGLCLWPVPGALGTEYWLRFASPGAAVGGVAWAHVYEPDGVRDPPSLVYGHGTAVELDSLDGVGDGIDEIVRQDVRLVRLEAPWHGRRRLPGRYGGEPFFATQPLGALDLFAAELREMATLVAWCRRRGAARVALGGISLGALACQLAACHARHWPAAARPDALFLATTGADVVGLVATSSLAHALGLPRALAAGGWTEAELARWRPLIDPLGEPAPLPADIVMLLGRTDDVTPFADGRALAARWRVPAENLFLPRRGHFSAAVGLLHDPAPLRRLALRLHRG